MKPLAVYFNELDPIACAVLRECHGGTIDGRSIKDVNPDDVRGFERCHFFAGAGLWQVAADMAGWHGPLWTASCPCQPFSGAGKRAGRSDPRHLWPDLFRIVRDIRPPILVGEQVAGPAGLDWFDGVAADLESQGYACRAVDIPACAVDAPHQRQRIYWVAVADTYCNLRERQPNSPQRQKIRRTSPHWLDEQVTMADAEYPEWRQNDDIRGGAYSAQEEGRFQGATQFGERNGSFWSDGVWLECADGKTRRAKPDLRLLVDGMAGRADLWRLAGNSIVPQVAAEVLAALSESLTT